MKISAKHTKQLYIQLPDLVIFIILMITVLVLPSVNSNELMLGITSGKMFYFLYGMIIVGVLMLWKGIIRFPSIVCFSKVDVALLVWGIYTMLSALIKNVPISSRLLEFFGLIVLYIVLRQISSSKYVLLFIVVMIGGFVQAVYGNLQLWGYYPSYHGMFKMTGSFFNPGPFAGYLASVFPIALGFYLYNISLSPITINDVDRKVNSVGRGLFNRFKPVGCNIVKYMIIFSIITILMVLPVSGSRAAWMSVGVSSVILLYTKFPVKQYFLGFSKSKQVILVLFISFITGITFFGLFHYKTASANGRLLVWRVTSGIVADNLLTGVGFDRFKAYYMDKQARYFEQRPGSAESMVAGDTNYCFNEFLQHTAENGLIGLILMITVLVCTFRTTNSSHTNLIRIAKAGIWGVIVFSLFSYPLQVLPVKVNVTCYLACISTLSCDKKSWHLRTDKYGFHKYILTVCILISLVGLGKLYNFQKAWKNWGVAYRLYEMRDYSESLIYYQKAWPLLKTTGDYLTHYGKTLSLANKHEDAINILNHATCHYPNTVIYIALGDSYRALGKPEKSEQAYLKAWFMNPGRFYPKYLLAKLYDETGQKKKADQIARELLDKEIKVESTAIDEIRSEMEQLLKKRDRD